MATTIRLTAEDTDYLLNAGQYGTGALMRVQVGAAAGGPFADLTGTGATPTITLVAGQRSYVAYDPTGTVTSWYRTRYENLAGTRLSDWSAAFQAAAEQATQLCTAGQVKARLFPGGVASDTTDDALLEDLIDQVTAWISNYCGRRFTPESATYTFDTQAGYVLRIARGIRSITTLEIAWTHQPDTGGTYTTAAATDYILRPLPADLPDGWPPTEVRISRAGALPTFATVQNGCRITGAFGFAAVPADIAAVAIDAVVAAFQARKDGTSSTMGAEDVAMPPWNKFFGRGSPQRGTLDRYRWVTL